MFTGSKRELTLVIKPEIIFENAMFQTSVYLPFSILLAALPLCDSYLCVL